MGNDYGWIEINKILLYHRACYHTPSIIARSAYFYVLGAGHFNCHKDFHLKRKDYHCYLVLYTSKGSGFLEYRGKQYEISRNQIMLLDCKDFQEYFTYKDAFWENQWVHFGGSTSDEYFTLLYETYGPVINVPENSPIPDYIEEIIKLMENEDKLFEVKASLLVLQILTSVTLAASFYSKISRRMDDQDYIQSAIDFIEQNYTGHISVEDIARAANLSVFHFSRLFRKCMGFTPYEYLVKYRMNKAKSLLLYTSQPIETIAANVGFQDSSSFIRTFKRLENITPLQFRKYIG